MLAEKVQAEKAKPTSYRGNGVVLMAVCVQYCEIPNETLNQKVQKEASGVKRAQINSSKATDNDIC